MIIRNILVAFALAVFMSCGSESVTPLEYPAKFEYSTSQTSIVQTFKIEGDQYTQVEPNARFQQLISQFESAEAILSSEYAEIYPPFLGFELTTADSLRIFSKSDPEFELISIPYLRDGGRIYFAATQNENCQYQFELNSDENQLTFSYGMSLYFSDFGYIVTTESCLGDNPQMVLENIIDFHSIEADTVAIILYDDRFELIVE